MTTWADPANSVVCVCGRGGGRGDIFLSHQRISQRAVRTSLEKQLDPKGPIASRGGSVSVFLRKPIATCDFSGGWSGSVAPPHPLDPPVTYIYMKDKKHDLLVPCIQSSLSTAANIRAMAASVDTIPNHRNGRHSLASRM